MSSTAIEKYLQHYAEPESRQLQLPPNRWQHVLVIPAYRESPALLDRLQALLGRSAPTLAIIICNRPTTAPGGDALADAIQHTYVEQNKDSTGAWYQLHQHSTLLRVDRYSKGREIPDSQGVGLARKIGADIACRLIHQGQVQHPWIYSSDGDVTFPENYFEALSSLSVDHSAATYPFLHNSEAGHDPLAIRLYEFSLHYYVAALQWAGSSYAHHTLGSCLAVNYRHYAQVRGFPRRSGGEDFYLLNKLAKTAPIARLDKPLLHLQDRNSDRVPFGTGPARLRISQMNEPLQEYRYYAPESFQQLQLCLDYIRQLAETGEPITLWRQFAKQCEPHHPGPAVLTAMGLERAIDHAHRHSQDPHGFQRHMASWLDGFRTLRFVHTLREKHYPSVTLPQLLQSDTCLAQELFSRLSVHSSRPLEAQTLAQYNQRLLQLTVI